MVLWTRVFLLLWNLKSEMNFIYTVPVPNERFALYCKKRYGKTLKFVPISRFGDYSENCVDDVVFSHAIAKFQDLVRFEK